jgi:hypothetical protein
MAPSRALLIPPSRIHSLEAGTFAECFGRRGQIIGNSYTNSDPSPLCGLTDQCAVHIQSKSSSLNPRFLIVLHSPLVSARTGLRFSPPEKMPQSCVVACRRPLSLVRFACVNHGIAAILRIFEAISRNFSVLQTVWRRGVDSNS